jgi:hypothetical protein
MNLSPLPIQKFFDNNGKPLVGGLLFTYAAGTTTKIATAKDQAGTANSNPIVLDYRGEANVWLDQTLTYKFTLAPVGDTDPPTKPIWTVDNISAGITYASLTAQIIGQILYPRSAAEISAGVTPTNYAINYGIVERYGAIGNDVANDNTAFASAFAVAAVASPPNRSLVSCTPGKKYFIGANTLVIPDGCEFDIRGTWIRTTAVTGITFGSNTLLSGFNAVIETSGGAGAALKKTDTGTPSRWDIDGWPYLFPTTMGTAGSIGIDFTAGYKSFIEPNVEGFETEVVGGANTGDTPQTYYVTLNTPRLRCTSGLTGIRLGRGCNGTEIINPQISGANVATKGIHLTSFGGVGAGSTSVNGGYIEAFLDNAATRAVLLTDAFNFTIEATTFDSTNTTGNFAIGSTGGSTQCNFYGCGFAGGWGSSTAIMSWTATGVYNFIGGAPTNQIMLLGLSTFTGSYANGEVRIGKITGTGQPTFAGAAAADYFGRFRNTADGQGALIENNSASLVAGRSVASLNRVGGPGYVLDFENNGTVVSGVVFCTGTPEAQITAPISTIACRTNGGAVTTFYVKETGTGNTGWVAK